MAATFVHISSCVFSNPNKVASLCIRPPKPMGNQQSFGWYQFTSFLKGRIGTTAAVVVVAAVMIDVCRALSFSQSPFT